jgi:hypothetical protein
LANAISKFDELVEKINISEPLPELLKQIKWGTFLALNWMILNNKMYRETKNIFTKKF